MPGLRGRHNAPFGAYAVLPCCTLGLLVLTGRDPKVPIDARLAARMRRHEDVSGLLAKMMLAGHNDNARVVTAYYWAALRPARPGEVEYRGFCESLAGRNQPSRLEREL
jgi:hypothetical protein